MSLNKTEPMEDLDYSYTSNSNPIGTHEPDIQPTGAKKRKRGHNFSFEEKDKFIKLLLQHKDIVLNKKTDGATNEAKNSAWNAITNSYNSTSNTHRNKESLIKMWEKLKSESKKYHAQNYNNSTQTRGGTLIVKFDPILEQVCSILDQGCTGKLGVPDCDSETAPDTEEVHVRAICTQNFWQTAEEANVQTIEEPKNLETQIEVTVDIDNLAEEPKPDNTQELQKLPINKTPLWSRRRQTSRRNDRNEATSSVSSSIQNVYKRKETIEDLKEEILREELEFKRKLYDLQLQAATKDVEIKTAILNQIKDIEIFTTVKIEKDDNLDSNIDTGGSSPVLGSFVSNLYEDHEIKEEMVIGPTVLQENPVVNCTDALLEYQKKHFKKKHEGNNMNANKGKEKLLEKCNVCLKTFTHISNLRRHIKQFHIGKYTFTCDLCKKTFRRKDYLVNHRKVVHQTNVCVIKDDLCNVKKITCDICEKEFVSPRKFERHLSYHRNITKNILHCDFCRKCFNNKDRLISHINMNHMAITLPYMCVTCGKKYSMKQSLAKHMSSHAGKVQFCCRHCNKYLRDKWSYRIHEKKCFELVGEENSNPLCKRDLNNNTYSCMHQDCNGRVFNTLRSFGRHWNKYHNKRADPQNQPSKWAPS